LYTGGLKTKPKFKFNGDNVDIINQPAIYGDELKSVFEKPEASSFFKAEEYYPSLFVHVWHDNLYAVRVMKTLPIWKKTRQPIYTTDDERLDYCMRILIHIKNNVEKNGSMFRVLILDNLNTFKDWPKGDPWHLVYDKLEQQDIDYFTYGDEFYNDFKINPDTIINKGLVHYSPNANRKVAAFLKETTEIRNLVAGSIE